MPRGSLGGVCDLLHYSERLDRGLLVSRGLIAAILLLQNLFVDAWCGMRGFINAAQGIVRMRSVVRRARGFRRERARAPRETYCACAIHTPFTN